MKQNSFSKKRLIHIYVVIFILVVLILIAATLMFKYHVEGERNLPFNLKKINVISTAESNILQGKDDLWNAKILQKNDIFFTIEKNSNYKKEEIIKKVRFENFKIIKENENSIISIYRPSKSVSEYKYLEGYKIGEHIEYVGALSTNIETLQINNQGGLIGFSVVQENIGEYQFSENEKLPSDGRLISKAGIDAEDINIKISFDIIIETEQNHKFKSNISLDLPIGNILEDGVGTLENSNLDDIVFKRF